MTTHNTEVKNKWKIRFVLIFDPLLFNLQSSLVAIKITPFCGFCWVSFVVLRFRKLHFRLLASLIFDSR